MTGEKTVFLIDQVVTKPGQARAFLNAYMERYAPGARARGMSLERSWVTPRCGWSTSPTR